MIASSRCSWSPLVESAPCIIKPLHAVVLAAFLSLVAATPRQRLESAQGAEQFRQLTSCDNVSKQRPSVRRRADSAALEPAVQNAPAQSVACLVWSGRRSTDDAGERKTFPADPAAQPHELSRACAFHNAWQC